ncbi:MAG: hypothetical protein A7315_11775 [Candidatus Altiarchaeales archaeon WOR_SM1_79]|nr:MAG: hypothetical protein A7315_11775 [Candidatus Altiarchaeales archaeon WOR_SM1_79]
MAKINKINKGLKSICIIGIGILMCLGTAIAEPIKLWDETIGGSYGDEGYGVAVDSNDNIIVTGYTQSFGAGGADVWTIKYDSSGNEIWNKTAGGSSYDVGYGVAVDSNDNIIVTGDTTSFGIGSRDTWTIKYDSSGNQLWNKTEGTCCLEYSQGRGVAVDSNDNIIVTGDTTSFGIGYDVWIIKYNSFGNQLWNKPIEWWTHSHGYGVAVDTNDNIIVTGYATASEDVWTIKCDPSGNQIWNKTASRNFDKGYGVAVDSYNSIIVTGYTGGSSIETKDVWTIKYDSSGNEIWNKTAGGGSGDYGSGVAVDSNNNMIVTGYTYSFGAGDCDVWTIKYSPSGEPSIVTLQGKLTDTGDNPVSTASMRVTIKNYNGEAIWHNTFNDAVDNGVFNIPLGARKVLELTPGKIYRAEIEFDVGSGTFISADLTIGDESPAGDVVAFTA